MKEQADKRKFRMILTGLESFFSSWRFPVFALSVLLFFALLVGAAAMIPVSDTAIGTFAEEFKTWCLGYDPATGEMETIYLVMFIVQPAMIGFFIWVFWYQPLMHLVKNGVRRSVPYILTGFILVSVIGSTLPSFYSNAGDGAWPFPAEQLRTEIDTPDFTLVNQHRQRISLDDYRGQVVMITAIYASCAETCPLILKQARRVFNRLTEEESGKVHLMALTMNPAKDTPRMLKMIAENYQLTAPNQHLLTGDAKRVNGILDRLNIPRRRREDGAIDHANIFILVDKKGKIAYRLTIGERQEEWLLKATRLLTEEPQTVTKTLPAPSSHLQKDHVYFSTRTGN